jgi:CPA2 family monovalent cation:H+ antiporter-2
MRQEYGLTVVAVVRDGVTHINPEASWVMRAGDTVHVFGERSFLVKGASLFEKPEED